MSNLGKLTSQIKKDAEALRSKVALGVYDDDDLSLLRSLLAEFSDKFPDNGIQLVSDAGEVSVAVLKAIIDRRTRPKLYNFLGAVSGLILACSDQILSPIMAQQIPLLQPEETLRDTKWVAEWNTIDRQRVARLIADVSVALQELEHMSRSNNSLGLILTGAEKDMLVAMLKTVIKMLEAPMIEVGYVRRTESWVSKILHRAVEKETETGVRTVISSASKSLLALLAAL